ncbi:MAG: ribbon-helix-helix protein, CopG family [Gemmatimonadota bacterium]|nr:ribbon-helix-helix protein, CopG family [Gemmatimonadota bacterium]
MAERSGGSRSEIVREALRRPASLMQFEQLS